MSYVIDIEIDVESNIITLTKEDGKEYYYTIEELEGRGVIDNCISGGSEVTVYSQNETYTLEEYRDRFGEGDL